MKTKNWLANSLGVCGVLAISLLAYNATASSLSSSSASSQHHRDMHKDDRGSHFDRLLNLTDDQKKTLQDARDKSAADEAALHTQIQAAHEALEQAVANNVDDAALSLLASDFAKLIAQKEIAHAKAHQFLLSILTAEQKQLLTTWESEHKNDFPPHGKFGR